MKTAILTLVLAVLAACGPASSDLVAPMMASSGGGTMGMATATGTGAGTSAVTDSPTGTSAGKLYFQQTVEPMFQSLCATCHADASVQVAVRGPETIYDYASMKELLTNGSRSNDNGVYDTIRNVIGHQGGDQCASGGDTASPCKEVLQWWHIEYGDDPPGTGDHGMITQITALGAVDGYAYDPSDAAQQVTVSLYADGTQTTGTLIATLSANLAGASGAVAGDHHFSYQLPATLTDGKRHRLYAYVTLGSGTVPIGDTETPTAFQAWAYSAAGQSYYAATVQNALALCASCHQLSYQNQYADLIQPSPAAGGSALTNLLISKPAEVNGLGHTGGVKCSSIAVSPCKEIAIWWQIEFGATPVAAP